MKIILISLIILILNIIQVVYSTACTTGTTITAACTCPTSGTPITLTVNYATVLASFLSGCNYISSITFTSVVTSIGDSTLSSSTSLTTVVFNTGSSISLGNTAFYGCTKLKTITWAGTASINNIGYNVFRGVGTATGSQLTSVTIPAVTGTIGVDGLGGNYFFADCTALQIIIITGGTTIGNLAFAGNPAVTSITFPTTITSIQPNAFRGYTITTPVLSFTSVTIKGYVPPTLFYGALGSYTQLTSVFIDGTVTSIGSNAFRGCTGITSIIIPSSVTRIGTSAFQGCSALVSVTIAGFSLATVDWGTDHFKLTSIGDSAFEGCTSLSLIHIPATCLSIGTDAFRGCTALQCYNMVWNPSITRAIGSNSVQLTPFPNGITTTSCTCPGPFYTGTPLIEEDESFYAVGQTCCGGYETVILPSTVTSIPDDAFRWCSNLKNISIPTSVTYIGRGAFAYTYLRTVVIPSSVTFIGDGAFKRVKSLSTISLPSGISAIPNYMFSQDTYEAFNMTSNQMTSITIPEGVTTIGTYAFYQVTTLTTVTLPTTLKSIGRLAFYKTGITAINLPSGFTTISAQAFSESSSLKSITIPDSVTTIAGYAFYGTSLQCINWNKAIVRTINVNAFPTGYLNLPACPTAEPTKAPTTSPTAVLVPTNSPSFQPTISPTFTLSPLTWVNNVINQSFPIRFMAIDLSSGNLYGVDGTTPSSNLLYQINTNTNTVTNKPLGSSLTIVYAITVFSPTAIYMSSSSSRIVKYDGTSIASFGNLGSSNPSGSSTLSPASWGNGGPTGLVCDTTGNVYAADFANNRIVKIDPTGGTRTLYATGLATTISPSKLAINSAGVLYVSEIYRKVWVVQANNGAVSSINIPGSSTDIISSIQVDNSGYLYICISTSGILRIDNVGNVLKLGTSTSPSTMTLNTNTGAIYYAQASGTSYYVSSCSTGNVLFQSICVPSPTFVPSVSPTFSPSPQPSASPTFVPSPQPSPQPTTSPTYQPSFTPTLHPTIDVKTACIPGSYLLGIIDGNVLCEICLEGTYGLESTCLQCPVGKSSGNGATNCIDCPPGMITFTSGSPQCYSCPAGFYSSSDHTQCIKCEVGKFSQARSDSCTSSC